MVCPIVREPDGLAMSSRNVYLEPDQRKAAPVLYRALQAARAPYRKGERSGEAPRRRMMKVLQGAAAGPQYVLAPTTTRCWNWIGLRKALLSMAVYFGKTRLIDNLVLGYWIASWTCSRYLSRNGTISGLPPEGAEGRSPKRSVPPTRIA